MAIWLALWVGITFDCDRLSANESCSETALTLSLPELPAATSEIAEFGIWPPVATSSVGVRASLKLSFSWQGPEATVSVQLRCNEHRVRAYLGVLRDSLTDTTSEPLMLPACSDTWHLDAIRVYQPGYALGQRTLTLQRAEWLASPEPLQDVYPWRVQDHWLWWQHNRPRLENYADWQD